MFSCLGRIQKFFQGEGPQIRHIFKRSFSAELLGSILRLKKALRGSGDMMFPRKIFGNLHTLVAILVLLEQVLGKFCLNCLPLILSVAPIMIHFVCTFFIVRAWGIRLIVIEKVRNYGKIIFIKTCLKMAGGGYVSFHPSYIRPCLFHCTYSKMRVVHYP